MREQEAPTREVREGYVVYQGCLRNARGISSLEPARAHTTEYALMGHCMESGYGLLDNEGRALLLEPPPTPQIVETLRSTCQERELGRHATPDSQEQEMRTSRLAEV